MEDDILEPASNVNRYTGHKGTSPEQVKSMSFEKKKKEMVLDLKRRNNQI